MAITPTPNNSLFKGFVFDDVDSRDYGVYISGDAVFNAPERDVEMIEIPGRNGAFALDKGRFSNIEVTYPAGLFGATEADFAAGINALRNALASRKGYCRLEDDYNPNEYRMAVYKSGLDVTPAMLKAGEFDIVFECKPQRYLLRGERPIAVADGDTVINPTLFDSKPLLKANGYGEIGINGETVRIINGVVGDVTLARAKNITKGWNAMGETDVPYTIPNYIDGDVTLHGLRVTIDFTKNSQYLRLDSGSLVIANISDTYNDPPTATASASIMSTVGALEVVVGDITMNGTDNRSIVIEANGGVGGSKSGGLHVETRINVYVIIDVNTDGYEITCTTQNLEVFSSDSSVTRTYSIGEVTGYSSELAADGTIYIDLDICEAYRPVTGGVVDLNANVDIPAEPPVLHSGANTITLGANISELDIVPRWWEV